MMKDLPRLSGVQTVSTKYWSDHKNTRPLHHQISHHVCIVKPPDLQSSKAVAVQFTVMKF